MPPPTQMIQPKRFIRRASRPLPQMTIGIERPMPKMTSVMSPCAAAATARTLSRLMTASATMMIQIASMSEVPCFTWPSASPPCCRTSLMAIQTSSAPPTTCRKGIRSRKVAMKMKNRRRPTAPAVPQSRPCSCWRGGRLRTASAMTSALSPASVRSMMMMLTRRAKNSAVKKSLMVGSALASLQSVEAPRIVGEDLALLRVAQVAALADLGDRLRERVIPVGEVGGVHDLVLADELHGRPQQPLISLAREVDLSRADVVARLLLQHGRLRGALGVLVVHALHPVRGPAAPGLEEREAQVREALGDALEDHRRELPHLAERVRAGVGLDELREQLDAGAAEGRSGGVDADHHVEPLRRLVDRREARVAEQVATVSGQHGAREPELAHRPLELDGGGVGILDRQQRHRLEPRGLRRELLVQERVVGAAERHRPLPLLEERQQAADGRIQHAQLPAAAIERPQPLLDGAALVAQGAEQPPIPPVLRIEGERLRAPAIRLVQVLRDAFVRLDDMTVGVDDSVAHFTSPL